MSDSGFALGPATKKAILNAAGIHSNTILAGTSFTFVGDLIIISLRVALPVADFFAAGSEPSSNAPDRSAE